MLEYATQDVSSMDMDNNEWVCIDLTPDSGACDPVMPRKAPCKKTKNDPSVHSKRGLQHEVANTETFPCLGKRDLELWTEGAETPKAMAMSVADVHKPQLSLERVRGRGI